MRKLIILFALIVSLAIPISASAAGPNSYNVPMSIRSNASSDPEYNEGDEYGHRIPQKKINCCIDRLTGITFANAEILDVHSYEIYDANGDCLAVFGDEDTFVEYLFMLNGEYQLRLATPTYSLVGYISCEE